MSTLEAWIGTQDLIQVLTPSSILLSLSWQLTGNSHALLGIFTGMSVSGCCINEEGWHSTLLSIKWSQAQVTVKVGDWQVLMT